MNVRYLLLLSIVVGAATAASAETIFDKIEEELFDDVLRPILDIFPRSPPHPDYAGQDVGGGPLFLSAVADPVEARRRARVPPFLGVKSYAGYITVNEAFNSNLFFWFFKAFRDWRSAPTLIWMNGGPGSTSLYGLFLEHGPFRVGPDGTLSRRRLTWASKYNVIYIDQPVGTGFSFTDSDEGHAKNETDVARDLYEFCRQFYGIFPELLDSDLYVTGESYAGKYVPALAHKIHSENAVGSGPRMPLKGIAIGDGLCDPLNQAGMADFLFETGLLDTPDRKRLQEMEVKAKEAVNEKDWTTATDYFNGALNFFGQKSGLQFYYNYLLSKEPKDFDYFHKWLLKPESRKAIHVGNRTFDGASIRVYEDLYDDMFKSVKPWIEDLLDADYKVLFYNGQLDVIIPYPATENFLNQLQWKGADEYSTSARRIWKVRGEVAGYARQVRNFRQVMVRNAGHILPYDQPVWAFDMIMRFVEGKSFGGSSS